MIRVFYAAVLGLLMIGATALADPITLALTPSGTVSGMPGDTVGWGYSIDNGSGDYLVVANSYFCEPGEDPTLFNCSPGLGASTYQDFIAQNFANNSTVINPGDTLGQSFDASSSSGVGEYMIDPSATPGQSDTGSIIVVYDLYDANPFIGPADQVGGDMEISASAEVDVTGTGTSPVPEPATRGLVVAGLLLLALAYPRIRFNRSPDASRSSI